jgi:hypothetical protein
MTDGGNCESRKSLFLQVLPVIHTLSLPGPRLDDSLACIFPYVVTVFYCHCLLMYLFTALAYELLVFARTTYY